MQIPGSEGRGVWGLDPGAERRAKGPCLLTPEEEKRWTAGFLGGAEGQQELRLNFPSGVS